MNRPVSDPRLTLVLDSLPAWRPAAPAPVRHVWDEAILQLRIQHGDTTERCAERRGAVTLELQRIAARKRHARA